MLVQSFFSLSLLSVGLVMGMVVTIYIVWWERGDVDVGIVIIIISLQSLCYLAATSTNLVDSRVAIPRCSLVVHRLPALPGIHQIHCLLARSCVRLRPMTD